ncbi:MAG: FAD-dependent thymidylate synthase [Nodosilinea sp.]
MDRFTVEVISQTPNPQQTMYAAMHQDYAEGFVAHDRDQWPNEERCGDILVTSLLKGGRGHYGPLEHPQIVFNVGWFPHSTMQQIRTHRVGVSFDVQCLAGDTEVTFVKASGMLRKVTIAELYDLWTNGEKAIRERKVKGRNGEAPGPYRRDCKRRLKAMSLRVLNEETGQFETSHLRDVMCSGLQPVYRMTFKDGRTLDCTTNHRLLTTEGWQTMGEAVGLETTPDGGIASITRHCSVLANGIVAAGKGLYRDKSWLVHQIELGRSAKEIADLAECSETAVRDWANRLGLRLNRSSTQFQKGHSPWNHDPDAAYHDKQWLDESLAYEFDNLVSLCKGCHEYIHHNHLEAEFAVGLQPITEPKNWQSKPKPESRKLRAHALKVIRVEYLGLQMTYDLEVEDPWHNFVANGLVVHNSFRYTGQRILDVVDGKRDVEEVFYLRPLGFYTDRQGKKYEYTLDARQQDLDWCLEASRRYKTRIDQGFAEEHARGLIPFDIRQHWVMSANVRSVMHLLDLRWKADAQLEAQKMCEAIWPHFAAWVPAIAAWYEENRLKKARLAP